MAKSWSVAAKERIDILCPEVILYYSQFMGVVDKLDFVMTLSPMRVKTRKWTVRVLSHFVSLALANLWLEYVRDVSNKGLTRSKTHDMMSFQIEVALSLIKQNQEVQKKRGRPRAEFQAPVRQAHNARPSPPNAVRYDGKDC